MPKIVGNITGRGSTTPAVFNVRSYGATGDGTTDDTAAFNAALSAMGSSAGGGQVYIPKGDYKITSSLQIPVVSSTTQSGAGVQMVVRGAGADVSYITYTGTGFAILIGNGGVNDARWQYIEDMTIRGSGANPDGAIKFNHSRVCGVRRCNIKDFSKAGAIGLWWISGAHNYFHIIEHCRIVSVPTGIKMESEPTGGIGGNSNWVRNCLFGSHSSYAVHIDGGDTNVFEQNEFNGSISTACYIEGVATNTKFTNNQFDGATIAQHIASSAVTGTMIIANSGSATITDLGQNTTVLNYGNLYARNGLVVGSLANGDPAFVPLTVRSSTSQATRVFRVLGTDSAEKFYVDKDGNWDCKGSGVFHSHTVMQADTGGNSIVATIDQEGSASGGSGLRIKQRSTGTTGDMLRLTNSDGTTLRGLRMNKDGYLAVSKTSAPADADISTGEAFLYIDTTAGAPALKVRMKDSAGTAFTRTLFS